MEIYILAIVIALIVSDVFKWAFILAMSSNIVKMRTKVDSSNEFLAKQVLEKEFNSNLRDP